MERLGAAILMSFVKDSVTAMANRNTGGSGGTTNVYGSAASGGEKIIEKLSTPRSTSRPPSSNQGDHIQVMVARDLTLPACTVFRSNDDSHRLAIRHADPL